MRITKSFSLIEVIIFASILSVIFVAVASVMTYTMKQNSIQIDKLFATHHNEELTEWLRGERETGWTEFTDRALVTYPRDAVYCFSTSEPAWVGTVNSPTDCAFALDGKYRRYASFKVSNTNPTTRVEITVGTEWMDGSSIRNTTLLSVFSM